MLLVRILNEHKSIKITIVIIQSIKEIMTFARFNVMIRALEAIDVVTAVSLCDRWVKPDQYAEIK